MQKGARFMQISAEICKICDFAQSSQKSEESVHAFQQAFSPAGVLKRAGLEIKLKAWPLKAYG
jgi:hypothetical protein